MILQNEKDLLPFRKILKLIIIRRIVLWPSKTLMNYLQKIHDHCTLCPSQQSSHWSPPWSPLFRSEIVQILALYAKQEAIYQSLAQVNCMR